MEISRERLHDILSNIDAPLLNLGFFDADQQERIEKHFTERLPQRIINAIDDVEERFSQNKSSRSFFRNSSASESSNSPLKWDNISSEEKADLLKYFARVSRSFGGYSNSEREKLKRMPIYQTAEGKCVRLQSRRGGNGDSTNNELQTYYTISPNISSNDFPLSQKSKSKVLELPKSRECRELYQDLSIQSLEEDNLVEKFVVPDFDSLSDTEKEKVVESIKTKWDILKRNSMLVKSIENLEFIPNMGYMTQPDSNRGQRSVAFLAAKELYDPENKMLMSIFSDQPYRFPTGKYRRKDWLAFLRDIGLVSEISSNVYFTCADKLALDGAKQMSNNGGCIDNTLAEKAGNLIQYFDKHFTELYSVESISRLRDIAFVPVTQPPLSRQNRSRNIKNESRKSSNNSSISTQGKTMVKFSACLLHVDRHLGWTQMPILPEQFQIQHLVLKKVGVQSPPPYPIVISHIQDICSELDNGSLIMSYIDTPPEVFNTILRYFEKRWNNNAKGVEKNRELAQLRLIFRLPVGSLLIRPTRLYFRMTTNLAPFMFEVPRAFGAFEKLLTDLGAMEKPLVSDYLEFLEQLKRETGNFPLNPNELNAVVKVITLIIQSSSTYHSESTGSNHSKSRDAIHHGVSVPFVPNESGRLVPCASCAYRDNTTLLHRIDVSKMNFANWKLNIDTCRSLSIPSLSEILNEEYTAIQINPDQCQDYSNIIRTKEVLNKCIKDTLFHKALGLILYQASSGETERLSMDTKLFSRTHLSDLQNYAAFVSNTLSKFSVTLAKVIKCKYTLKFQFGGVLSRGDDVTRAGHEDDNCFFVDNERCEIVLALDRVDNKLLRIEQILSAALDRIFASNLHNLMVVDTLLCSLKSYYDSKVKVEDSIQTLDASFEAILLSYGISHDTDGAIERRRGRPGNYVTKHDKEALMLKPLRVFLPGEIVALEAQDGMSDEQHPETLQMTSDEDVRDLKFSSRNFKYAVVIGTSDENGNTLKRVELITGSRGQRSVILSSSIYSFKTSSKRTDDDKEGQFFKGNASSSKESRFLQNLRQFKQQKNTVDKSTGSSNNHAGSERVGRNDDYLQSPGSANYIHAVQDLLAKVGLSIDSDRAELMSETLRLRKELEVSRSKQTLLEDRHQYLETDAKRVADAFICKICMEREVNRFIIPSGKLICDECATNLRGICPFTRRGITGLVQFFNPLTT